MIDNTEILGGSKGIVNCKCLSESQNMISLPDSTNGKSGTRAGNSGTFGIADHRPATVYAIEGGDHRVGISASAISANPTAPADSVTHAGKSAMRSAISSTFATPTALGK
jgi:hypothetical protein